MSEGSNTPIYLTAAGRRRLEQRLAGYGAEVARRSSPDVGQPEGGDRGDAALQLSEADDRDLVQGLVAQTRELLDRAVLISEGPDDGIVRLGSTVRLRDGNGAETQVQVVHGAELDDESSQVAVDSPVGQAVLGHHTGDQVDVSTPESQRRLTLLAVAPYREHAGGAAT